MEIKFLSCPVCSEAHFQSLSLLRNALIEVTKKPLSCPICQEVILGLDKFTIHLFTHCDINNEILNATAFEIKTVVTNDNNNNNENSNELTKPAVPDYIDFDHHAAQLNIPPENLPTKENHCEICNFDFMDTNMLDMHRTLLHSNGFSCHLCQKKFKMHGSLMVHMRVVHYGFKNKLITNIPDAQITENEVIIEDKSKDNLVQNNENSNERVPPPKTVDNKQWECDECLKKFTTKYFLKKHKRLHTGEMPYECILCNKSFTFQQSYHKHMLYHSADKPHTCHECGRAFKELSTLHNHQRIHSGERPFECETCGKRFRQRVSYLVHKRIHTGAMPYKCTSCDKSFRYKVSQRTHKCKAQPPGSVVRQFGDLVQKLLQNRTDDGASTSSCNVDPTSPEAASNIMIASSTDVSTDKPIPPCPEINQDFFGLVMSPTFQITSDQFESLCLSSKESENNHEEIFNNLRSESSSSLNSNLPRQECSTINEECLKQLLYSSPQ